MPFQNLPIWEIHGDILSVLGSGNRLVLVAPTGSGKTTQVPQMLLDAGLAGERKIVVLQPRRVAARTVAARVAWERQKPLGQEVGYQVRFDDQTTLGTRISYVTEGILLRWLQDDPTLADTSIVLFDEFHERNLFSDVALGLVKQLQATSRRDLKLAVMSATLDAEPVAEYLGACPILVSEGQSYPVEVHHLDQQDERPVSEQAADMVERLVNSGAEGDILVFMPGMGEINGTINALRAARTHERLAFIPLHGELPPEEQDVAFAQNPLRKIVVATNVAETSVTIDGIRHVVDSGVARIARYDADRGINSLLLEEISRASAEQRKGRAGRTAPGTCWRLWTESGHLNRPERNTPEIQRSDLAEVVLLLHSLGIRKAAEFDWLDNPDPSAVERAEKLLHLLGAVDEQTGDLTPSGRQMLRLPMHPRYSRMLVEAAKFECVSAAALCAALVSGRDLLVRLGREQKHISEARELFEASQDSDFYTLMRAYQFARNNHFNVDQLRRYGIHAQTARQVEQTFNQIMEFAKRQRLVATQITEDGARKQQGEDPLLRSIMAGFIDQVCVRRDLGTLECEMAEHRQGTLMRESVVQNAPLFVAATIREVEGRGSKNLTLFGLATAVKREWIVETFPQHIFTTVEHLFDRTHKRVAAVKLVRFRDLVIHHEHQRDVEAEASGRCLAQAWRKGFFQLPLLDHETKQFIARVNLLCALAPELDFPPLDDAAIEACLGRAFSGLTLVKEAQAVRLVEAFRSHLHPEQVKWLDELMPIRIPVPAESPTKLLYPDHAVDEDGVPNAPEAQIKLQQILGLREHPHICEGKVAVKLWLAGPDGKRLESTFNFPAFKANTYPKLKVTLQKKYPGVAW